MIDLAPMKGIRVDPVRRTASAQAGLRLGEFDRETQAFALATTLGVNTDTGIAGLTLGGGYGWLDGKHGLACDNVLAVDVVTTAGRLMTASADGPELGDATICRLPVVHAAAREEEGQRQHEDPSHHFFSLEDRRHRDFITKELRWSVTGPDRIADMDYSVHEAMLDLLERSNPVRVRLLTDYRSCRLNCARTSLHACLAASA